MAKRHSSNGSRIPAVAYLRCSSDKQTEKSIPGQREAITTYAEQESYRIVRWYVDEGISGDATDKRLDFQRMIRDAQEQADFKAIVCWDQDRFGRFDGYEAGYWIHPLRKHGVYLDTVTKGLVDWNDSSGRLVSFVETEGNHAYLQKLSEGVLRGLERKAKTGEWPGGKPPRGYVVGEDGFLVLGDPSEVEMVRRIFRDYLAGKSLRGIVRDLNDEGYRTSRNGLWNGKAIRHILRNRHYLGHLVWGDNRQGRYSQGEELILVPNSHPAIIDERTFEQVQRRLVERQNPHFCSPNERFILTGLIRCGECGSPMLGDGRSPNVRYCCGLYRDKGLCQRNTVWQEELLEHIVGAIVGYFTGEQTEERLRNELLHQMIPKNGPSKSTLKRKANKCRTELDRLNRRLVMVDDEFIGTVQDAIRAEKARLADLETALKTAETPRKAIERQIDETVEQAMEAYQRLQQTLLEGDTLMLRELLRETVKHVDLWTDPVKLPYGKKGRYTYRLKRGVITMRGTSDLLPSHDAIE